MYCEKCGNLLEETDGFCEKCGSPVVNVENDGSSVVNVQNVRNYREHKGKKKVLLFSGVAVAVIALVILAIRVLPGFYMRHFAEPEEYLQYVGEKALDDGTNLIASLYGNVLESFYLMDWSADMNVNMEVNEEIMELLSMYTQVDLSWLTHPGVHIDISSKDEMLGATGDIMLDGKPVVSAEAIYDLQGEEAYLQVPELSGTWMKMNWRPADFDRDFLEILPMVYEACPDKQMLKQVLWRYGMLAISCIQDVEKGEEILEAEGVSEKCITLSFVIDENVLYDMAEALLEAVEDDEELENCIYDVAEALSLNGRWVYNEFLNIVDELNRDARYILDADIYIPVTLYIGSGDEIHGFEVDVEDVEIYCAIPQKGREIGLEAGVRIDRYAVELVGNGKYAGKKLDGEFTLRCNGVSYINLAVEDFKTAELKKARVDGCVTITVSDSINRLLGMAGEYLPIDLTSYGVRLDMNIRENLCDIKLAVLEKNESMVTLQVSVASAAGKKVTVPTQADIIRIRSDEDIADWAETIQWEAVFERLEAFDIPRVYINMLEEMDWGGSEDAPTEAAPDVRMVE